MVAVAMVRRMDIQPVSLDQIVQARDGSMIVVDGDIAKQLKEIDRSLVLRWHAATEHWSVIQKYVGKGGEPREQLVATCQPIPGGAPHPKLVDEVRRVASPQHDPIAELERAEKQRVRDQEHQEREDVGERLERAHFAFRTMVNQRQDQVFVP